MLGIIQYPARYNFPGSAPSGTPYLVYAVEDADRSIEVAVGVSALAPINRRQLRYFAAIRKHNLPPANLPCLA
jgi:hypothetical protein